MRNKNVRYEDIKKYCIPNLRACDDKGNEYPVVTTIQADYEWRTEYKRALYYKRLTITELVIIALLSMALIFKGEIWEK